MTSADPGKKAQIRARIQTNLTGRNPVWERGATQRECVNTPRRICPVMRRWSYLSRTQAVSLASALTSGWTRESSGLFSIAGDSDDSIRMSYIWGSETNFETRVRSVSALAQHRSWLVSIVINERLLTGCMSGAPRRKYARPLFLPDAEAQRVNSAQNRWCRTGSRKRRNKIKHLVYFRNKI